MSLSSAGVNVSLTFAPHHQNRDMIDLASKSLRLSSCMFVALPAVSAAGVPRNRWDFPRGMRLDDGKPFSAPLPSVKLRGPARGMGVRRLYVESGAFSSIMQSRGTQQKRRRTDA